MVREDALTAIGQGGGSPAGSSELTGAVRVEQERPSAALSALVEVDQLLAQGRKVVGPLGLQRFELPADVHQF